VLAEVAPRDADLTVLVAATPYGFPAVIASILAMASFTAVLILAGFAASHAASVSDALAVANGRADGATEPCTHHVADVPTHAVAIERIIGVANACPAFRFAACLDDRRASMSGELWLQAVTVNHFADDLLDF